MRPQAGRRFPTGIPIAGAEVPVLTIAVWLALDATLVACPICFQAEDGPASAGVRAAVLVLMAVTSVVLSGFAVFIARFVRRAALER